MSEVCWLIYSDHFNTIYCWICWWFI